MVGRNAYGIKEQYGLFVDGEDVSATEGETFTPENPATEEPIADVAEASEEDVDSAVTSAQHGHDLWIDTSPADRGRILSAIADAIRDEADWLARIEVLDCGKPLSQATSDVRACARYFEYYAGIADKIHGDSIPFSSDHIDYTVREPLGVTGQILPWNFPIKMLGRSVAPALAAGNAAVVKPAEQTPITALEVARLAVDAGLPAGALNVVPGFGAEAGTALASHPAVRGVSFTGSVMTGRKVAKTVVENVNSVHLELGGKNPNVVFPDADFESAVSDAIGAIFRNSGQMCSAGSRLLVHEDVHEEFVDELVQRAADLSIGRGLDDPDVGPLASRDQLDKVTRYIEIGREEAGAPVLGGSPLDRDGYYVEPTIFDGVESNMRIAQEEIFGPVLSVLTFEDEEEAVELANDVDYGLVAGIFTSDVGRAHRVAREIDAGQVSINEWSASGVETPFGGFKNSGFGREKGLEALEEYTQIKNICANIRR